MNDHRFRHLSMQNENHSNHLKFGYFRSHQ
jgi:hypothetical protein